GAPEAPEDSPEFDAYAVLPALAGGATYVRCSGPRLEGHQREERCENNIIEPGVTRPREEMDTSGMTPIDWPLHVHAARRRYVTSAQSARRPQCQNTFHPVSVRETPNAAARCCIRGRRTPVHLE